MSNWFQKALAFGLILLATSCHVRFRSSPGADSIGSQAANGGKPTGTPPVPPGYIAQPELVSLDVSNSGGQLDLAIEAPREVMGGELSKTEIIVYTISESASEEIRGLKDKSGVRVPATLVGKIEPSSDGSISKSFSIDPFDGNILFRLGKKGEKHSSDEALVYRHPNAKLNTSDQELETGLNVGLVPTFAEQLSSAATIQRRLIDALDEVRGDILETYIRASASSCRVGGRFASNPGCSDYGYGLNKTTRMLLSAEDFSNPDVYIQVGVVKNDNRDYKFAHTVECNGNYHYWYRKDFDDVRIIRETIKKGTGGDGRANWSNYCD